MVRQSPTLEMTTRLNAGRNPGFFGVLSALIVALIRKVFGGESLFVNEFAGAAGGEVVLAPALSGHIKQHSVRGGAGLFVQRGSYLASTGSLDTKVRWGGLKALFGGEGLVLLHCTGEGELFVNSYGGVVEMKVTDKLIVDTGHIVAFEDGLDFKVRSVGGLKSFLFSGEGLVCEFSGQGRVYVQSRNMNALVSWLSPMLSG
jgi:uncharacterized protein (TIGR00266 family)